jgi:tetratricopeptide (TPR) repeat protein
MPDEPPLFLRTTALDVRGAALIGARQYRRAIRCLDRAIGEEQHPPHIMAARITLNRGVARWKIANRTSVRDAARDFARVTQLLRRDLTHEGKVLAVRAWQYLVSVPGEQFGGSTKVLQRMWHLYRGSPLPEEKAAADLALNGLAFAKVLHAKKEYRRGRPQAARRSLEEARCQIRDLLARRPEGRLKALALGNKAYIHFLLGDPQASRLVLREALELGGSDLRRAEILDSKTESITSDREFRKLVEDVATQVSSESMLRRAIKRLATRRTNGR